MRALNLRLRMSQSITVQATNKVLAATACIVGGCLLLVIFGNHTSDTLTVKDMIEYYDR